LTPQASAGVALPEGAWLAFGNGRSYGDSCFPADGTLIDMRGMNRVLHFNAATGLLRAEAGLLLGDLLPAIITQGWFPPVVPGTRHVTLGGAVATISMARTTMGTARSVNMCWHWSCCGRTGNG
jgi:FAD/FMN-containing dehydrogenase